MNSSKREQWKSQVLDLILEAFAASDDLREALIFKGARVLNLLLQTDRQSLDLDSNLHSEFARKYSDREMQRQFLESAAKSALRNHFRNHKPIRFELDRLTVENYPHDLHPLGWDGHIIRINVRDSTMPIRGLPKLEIDVASPEILSDESTTTISVAGYPLRIYTLTRIAGEKLRAFLSSLPTYRAKVKKPGSSVRAKDLYDLARIRRVHALTDEPFWRSVGEEFVAACRSRFIDCLGLPTFQEAWAATEQTYRGATIPKEVPFREAEEALMEIVAFLKKEEIIPFEFPIFSAD